MKKKRIKYDLALIIKFYELEEKFDVYKADNDLKRHCSNKKPLSIKRLMRSFLKHEEKLRKKEFGLLYFTFFQDRFVIAK